MGKDPKPTKSVKELLKEINNGDYVIPHFQRSYEWSPSMVVDLLKSIIQDYFSGLLLFWELDSQIIKEEKWDPLWGTENSRNPVFAILDGQQRLASLYYAFYGPAKKFPNRNSYYTFFIDVKRYHDGEYEEAVFYRYSSKYMALDDVKKRKNEWINNGVLPLRIFSDKELIRDFKNQWALEYAKKYTNKGDLNDQSLLEIYRRIIEIEDKILGYEFVTHTLGKERELPDICNIFARINQKGMRLTTFDLMNAFLYPKGISLRKLWESLSDEMLKEVDSNMNEYLLKRILIYSS